MNKATKLKTLIQEPSLSFIMESHNALSAKIAENAGFEALWASGLSISASMGLSDRNEASWTQILEIVEHMADHVSVPVLFDGDSGFGNFNNVARLVKKLGQRGVSGVCLEDKLFPKQNSFIGEGQELADVVEFSNKIKAAKDSQIHLDFCVVARIEALISGLPMEEALERANAYSEAGADAILIHSKKSCGDEIIEFCRLWDHKKPIIIVPTKYYERPTSDYKKAGVSSVIWANHSLRASIRAIQDVTKKIKDFESVAHVESEIASLQDVFSLTNEYDVQIAEKKYLYG